MSTLDGLIPRLRRGEPLDPEQIDELERLLGVLQDNGWAGNLTADEAAKVLVGRIKELENFIDLPERFDIVRGPDRR